MLVKVVLTVVMATGNVQIEATLPGSLNHNPSLKAGHVCEKLAKDLLRSSRNVVNYSEPIVAVHYECSEAAKLVIPGPGVTA